MTTFEVLALIVSGVFVGFINTLAGGGTIISLSLFMFMGLPADVANGTNRIAVILQNFTSTVNFKRQKLLDTRKAIKLMIPTVLGAITGAQLSVEIDEATFRKALGLAMIMMVYFMIVKPDKWINGQQILQDKKVSKVQCLIFFLIGIYGGFVQVGVGYFLLAGIVLGAGYDLIRANAIKGLIVMVYTIFALIVFVLNDKVHWQYGLVHSIGNVTGAFIASHYALTWGAAFIRWFIIVLIIITSADLFGIIDLKSMF
ncbi:MAG TPA: sulfite exporter TauE/SafE family protein [Prolixibacteraceae bacterium]|nr:sulfite exporter TauE/SafE family protein [Lentimicrobium sp.]HLN73251.1 sulfite exporter TauE/SafE family protein [Prolixibacteraceae bacterium]